jgi:hypothetical protein
MILKELLLYTAADLLSTFKNLINMLMLKRLSLPSPKEEVKIYAYKILNEFDFSQRKIDWTIQTWGKQFNYADVEYYHNQDFSKMVIDDVQHHFNANIDYVFIILMSSWDKIPRCMPPHTDKMRRTAVNYYFELGGEDPELVFYTKHGNKDIHVTDLEKYENLDVQSVHKLQCHSWFAFNGKQFHSVENITDKRLCITLSFKEDLAEFYELNAHLL